MATSVISHLIQDGRYTRYQAQLTPVLTPASTRLISSTRTPASGSFLLMVLVAVASPRKKHVWFRRANEVVLVIRSGTKQCIAEVFLV